MPEGDSIHRARMRLEPMLAGEALTYFWAARLYGHAPRPGQSIESTTKGGQRQQDRVSNPGSGLPRIILARVRR